MQSLQKITSVRFFNKDLEMIGEVRNYTSLIFIRRWETFGEFELHTKIPRPDLFQQGNYIMLDNDPYRSGIILEHNDDTDGYGVNSLEDITIKGFSLLYKLFGRWTIPPPTNNGYYIWNSKPVEDIIYDLVRDSAVNPANNKRKIPHLVLGENKHRGEKLTYQSRLKRVSDELNALSLQSGLGVSIKLDAENKQLVFEVLDGIDRSYAEDNPNSYVFSKKNRRVTKRKYSYTAKGMANMAYVAGQGDGEDREIETINDDLAGDDRWETYIDARDVERESEESESNTTLADRGRVKLAEMSAAESYEFEANPIDYRELWDLGDICTFYDPENGGYMLFEIVTEIREVYEGDALTVQPTFGHASASISQSISAANSSGTTERAGLSAKFKAIFAEYAEIQTLVANKADIKDLNAVTATVETLRTQTAEIRVLVADKASIGDLNVATARITELEADTADIRKAIIDVAHIGDLTAITADITSLKADVADIDTAMIGKADIDLANIKNGCITTAMIGTGVIGTTQIADGSITDAKIVGLTANKITAGRLDAAQIEVVNLNAANITVGTINGVQIAQGAITGDKLAQQVNDQITGAASAAQQALTTADGKNKIYYQATQPGLTGNKKGDTWFDTANGYRAYVWNGTAWSLSPFGSAAIADDAVTLAKVGVDLQSFMDGINNKAVAAQTSADGKNTVFYQTTQPPTTGRKTGDTWFKTDDGNKVYRWNGTAWAAVPFGAGAIADSIISTEKLTADIKNQISNAAVDATTAKNAAIAAQTTADGKNKIYYQAEQPGLTGNKKGDTWFNTAEGYKAYVWNGTSWSASPFGSDALSDVLNNSITTAGTNASTALTNAATAKAIADQAKKDAQTAQSSANAAQTAANQAAKDLEAAEKNLLTVTGRVDATEEEIAAAQAAVEAAQSKANSAAQAAATAQNTADTAKQNAATAQTKADNAYSLADQAKKAAATAQTSADGKNTVFYQTTQPPATGRKTGDTWFKTDDGNKVYRWNGTAWAAVPFGAGAIEDNIISAEKLTTVIKDQLTTAGSNASTALANAAAAKAAADQAKIDAQTAQTSADAAQTAANQAAKDLVDAEKNLAAVTGRVDATEEEIAAAQAAVTTAQNKANAAAQAAATAQSTADTAKQNAATAQSKANSAYSLADQAKTNAATAQTAANAAKDAAAAADTLARAAQTSANSAQTTADGKNTVFYATTAPATTGRKTNDIWFDTANGNRMYYFSGTAWTLKQFGTNALANLTITNALIADAAINNAKIANLDAGKITTGIISADRIGAGTLTVGKLTEAALAEIQKPAEDAQAAAEAAASAAATAQGTANTAKSTAETAKTNAAAAQSTADTAKTNAATAHSAADAAKATLAAWCYNNNLTYIDGGDIYTGTVTAAKIAAGAISTEKLAANAVTAAKITAGTITGDKIAGKTISADKIVAGTITASSGVIANGAILAAMIGDAQIGTAKIANLAVTGAKIANATITNAQIADATIQSAKIAALDAGKITTGTLAAARIAAGSITADKLASKSITVGQISDAAIKGINDLITIGARNLLRNSGTATTNTSYGTRVFNTSGLKPNTKYTFVVNGFTSAATQTIGLWFNNGSSGGFRVSATTTAKTQFVVCTTPATLTTDNVNIYNYPSGSTSCTINWACLYEGEVKPPMDWTPAPEDDTAAIATNSIANWCYNNNLTYINGGKIYTGTVTATQIAANAIVAGKIAANAVTTATVAAGAINADKLAANSVTAVKIAAGTITGDKIAGKTISADKIVAGTITANSGVIANGAILAAMIGDAQIGTAKIANLAVTGAKIANATITNAQIADATIQSAKIASLDAAKITTGTLSADRIAAGSIVFGKLDSTTQGNINTAKSNANAALLLEQVETITGSLKKFKNVCGYTNDAANVKGYLIITTPITPSRMVNVHISGYNYVSANETIDLRIGFYNYGSSITSAGYVNNGSLQFSSIKVAKVSETDTRAVIIIGSADTVWQYPKIIVDEVITGYSTVCPDSYKDGFSATITATLPTTYVHTATLSGSAFKNQIGFIDSVLAAWCYSNDKTYINGGKIYTGSIAAAQIAANAVVAGKIAANAVTAGTIVAGAVTLDKLAANSVNASKIVAGSITAAQIAASTITGAKIAATTIAAGNLAANSVTSDKIVADAVTTAKIAAKAVTANEIAAGTITAAQIAANAITATQLAAGAVTAAKIGAGQITADKIAAGAITADKFYGTAITSKNYVANSAGTKIDLTNGIIDTKNFKVDSAGNVAMTGTLTMQGAQSMTIKNASAAQVGTISFKAVSGDTWSPGALNVLGKGLLHLVAGDSTTTKAYVEGYVGGYNLFEMGREGSNYGVWMGTSATARIGVSNAQSPQVYAEGCTKAITIGVNVALQTGSVQSGRYSGFVKNGLGNFITFGLALRANLVAGSTNLFILPAEYRPKVAMVFPAFLGVSTKNVELHIYTTGQVLIYSPTAYTNEAITSSGIYYIL